MRDDHHPFRSPAAKERYLAFYDQLSRSWPEDSETRMVDTSYGQTFMRIQGPTNGPPLVLLPGDAESSLAWTRVIDPLSAQYRTYALDHIYDNGRSIYRYPFREPTELVSWLDELFDELRLDRLNLVAHSYGAWQASLYALAHPARLRRLVLLAPSATVLQPSPGLLARAMLYYFVPFRAVTKRYLYWYASECVRHPDTRVGVDEMIDEQMLARKTFKRRKFLTPTVLTDDEWSSLRVPTLFMIGDRDVTHSATKAIGRLHRVAPQIKTMVASDADHHLALLKPDWVANNVLDFLA